MRSRIRPLPLAVLLLASTPALGRPIAPPPPPERARPTAFALDYEGRTVAVAHYGAIDVAETETGHRQGTLRGHEGDVYLLAFGYGGRLASASTDGAGADRHTTVKVWQSISDYASPRFEFRVDRHVAALGFDRDGTRLVAACEDGTLEVWDVESKARRAELPAAGGRVVRAAFSASRVATADASGTVTVRGLSDGDVVRALRAGPEPVVALALSPDGRSLAAGYRAGGVAVWDVESGRRVASSAASRATVVGVGFELDGAWLAVARADGEVSYLDARDGSSPAAGRASLGPIAAAAFSSDGHALAALRATGDALAFATLNSGDIPRVVAKRPETTGQFAASPDGRYVAVGGVRGTVLLWSVATGRAVRVFRVPDLPESEAMSLAFSPDSRSLAAAMIAIHAEGLPGSIVVWDVESGSETRRFERNEGWNWWVSFSLDGRRLVGGHDFRGVVWDVATGRRIWAADGPILLGFGRDANEVMLGEREGLVFRDVDSGSVTKTVPLPSDSRTRAISPTRRLVASESTGRTVTIVDLATGALVREIALTRAVVLPYDRVASLSFSSDERLLAVRELERTTVFDVSTGDEVRYIPSASGSAIAFGPGGMWLVGVARDALSIGVWDLPARPVVRPTGRELAVAPARAEGPKPPDALARTLARQPDFMATLAFWREGKPDFVLGALSRRGRVYRFVPSPDAFSERGREADAVPAGDTVWLVEVRDDLPDQVRVTVLLPRERAFYRMKEDDDLALNLLAIPYPLLVVAPRAGSSTVRDAGTKLVDGRACTKIEVASKDKDSRVAFYSAPDLGGLVLAAVIEENPGEWWNFEGYGCALRDANLGAPAAGFAVPAGYRALDALEVDLTPRIPEPEVEDPDRPANAEAVDEALRSTSAFANCTAIEATPTAVRPGERVALRSVQRFDDWSYLWSASGGRVLGEGPSVELDTTGLAPGSYVVTLTAINGSGDQSECEISVTVTSGP